MADTRSYIVRGTNRTGHADGIILASPADHGFVSGVVKNALDYVEDLADDPRCYFDGLAVGCIATGAGCEATVMTLEQLRAVAHALRGWPTPLGANHRNAADLRRWGATSSTSGRGFSLTPSAATSCSSLRCMRGPVSPTCPGRGPLYAAERVGLAATGTNQNRRHLRT